MTAVPQPLTKVPWYAAAASALVAGRKREFDHMTIPKFDTIGNLPLADHFGAAGLNSLIHPTLAEVKDRFVHQIAGSLTRAMVWDGWMRHRHEIEKIGLSYATLVDGSFITDRVDPGDIDVCVLVDAVELNLLPKPSQERFRELHTRPRCKDEFQCDAYPLAMYRFTEPLFAMSIRQISYWTRVFGADRNGNPKAFLLITEGGTV